NVKVADFEKQTHSLKLQLNATVESHKTLSTTVECLKKESKQKEDKYLNEVIDLQNENKALDNVVYKMGQSTQTMHMLTKPQAFYDESHKTTLGYQNPFYLFQDRRKVPALYDGHTIVKTHDALSVTDTEETLELAKESRLKMLAKQNDPSLKEKKNQLSAQQAFWLHILQPFSVKPPILSEPVLKKEISRELPPVSLVKDSFHKMKEHVNKFDETITFHTKIIGDRIGSWGVEHIKGAFEKDVKPFAQTLKEYFQLFEHGLFKELKEMKVFFNQIETEVAKCSVDKKYFEIEKKELSLDNNRLLEHIICQDVMNTVMHANVHSNNVLHANTNSLEHDNSTLELLKHENDRLIELLISQDLVHTANDKVVYNELSKRCFRLENRRISLEIKLQQSKESFQTNRPYHNQDAPKVKEFFIINELQAQLKAKNVSIEKLKEHIANIKGKNVVENYLKHTQENADILCEIVEHARDLRPMDSDFDSACKFVTRIQESLVYVSATCPSSKHVSDKLVAVTPINRTRKVRFAESKDTSKDKTLTRIQPQEKQTTNNAMSPSTGVSNYTEASGSKPGSNTKKDRITQTSICNANVKHFVLNVNSELIVLPVMNICLMLFMIFVLVNLNDVHACVKSKFVKSRSTKSNKKKMVKNDEGEKGSSTPWQGINVIQAFSLVETQCHTGHESNTPRKEFALIVLTQQAQVSLKRIASLVIRVRSFSDPTDVITPPMIGKMIGYD
ncbi:hypothetical protein Tco_0698378, partial [Tanacetum coccineum]